MTMRDMTEADLAAHDALLSGNLEPLGDLLSIEADLHPLIQRRLRKFIIGDAENVDFKLILLPHPNSVRSGIRAKMGKRAEGMQAAIRMAQNGAFVFRNWKNALNDTVADYARENIAGMGTTTIKDHWKEHKKFVAACIAHGLIELKDEYRPRSKSTANET